VEPEETVIIQESEPEEREQMKRGGSVYKGSPKALLKVKMKMKR
jgi:hypothetical protein